MTRRPKRGPAPGTTGAGRTAHLHLRVSPEEHAAYSAYAARWGRSVSEWAREVLTAQLPASQPVEQVQRPASEREGVEDRPER